LNRRTSCLLLAAFLLQFTSFVSAQTHVPPAASSADEIAYAQAAASDPLTETAKMQRKAAMKYAEDDHTSHVSLCLQIFQQMTGNHSANASEITTQYLISAAAFLYQHPEVASDSTAQNVAGMDAALNVYEKFLAADSKTRFKFLDNLDKQRNDGKLKDAIQRICK
jgi:hypothetical protein